MSLCRLQLYNMLHERAVSLWPPRVSEDAVTFKLCVFETKMLIIKRPVSLLCVVDWQSRIDLVIPEIFYISIYKGQIAGSKKIFSILLETNRLFYT